MLNEVTQTFKDLLGQQISRTLSLSAVQSVSQFGRGSLIVGILPNGVIELTHKNSEGVQRLSYVNYETLKQGSKNLGFLEEFVLNVLQSCEYVESNLSKRKEIPVPSDYSILFKILKDDRTKWTISVKGY